jgi:hypothetical protein
MSFFSVLANDFVYDDTTKNTSDHKQTIRETWMFVIEVLNLDFIDYWFHLPWSSCMEICYFLPLTIMFDHNIDFMKLFNKQKEKHCKSLNVLRNTN